MKKVIIAILCLSVGTTAVKAQNKTAPLSAKNAAATATPAPVGAAPAPQESKQPDANAGKFKFAEEIHYFKDVPEGPQAQYDFEFKNTGKKPINITEAHGSCGCTVPSWPHEPIKPGATAKIHVTYNTDHRPGMIDKAITITSDAQQSPMMLYIKGNVIPKPAEAAPAAAPANAPATH
jgi:hypothetical protein